MKVYVIKNKEGKYWGRCADYDNNFEDAIIIEEPYKRSYRLREDEYWQEVTLCEGDLEKELAVRDKALRKCFTCGVGFQEGMYKKALDEARKELEDKDDL